MVAAPGQVVFVGDHWVLEWTYENPVGLWFDCEEPKRDLPESPLAQAWKKIIRDPVIPWKREDRRRRVAHAYVELGEEAARWEEITRLEQQRKEDHTRDAETS